MQETQYGPYGSTTIGINMSRPPTSTDDWNSGWYEGCIWQYQGFLGVMTYYICVNSVVGAAVWKILV
jgi:hypothetical protein